MELNVDMIILITVSEYYFKQLVQHKETQW